GDRTSQHALDVLVRQGLCVLCPLHGHGLRAGDVTNHDWWTGATGAVGLDPAVFGDHEAIEKLCEVLHHVIALWLAVHQHIQTEAFLQLNDAGYFLAQLLNILLIAQDTIAVIRAGLTNIRGLRERTNRRGRQDRQLQRLLRFLTLSESRLTLYLAIRQRGRAVCHLLVVGTGRFSAGTHRAVRAGIGFRSIQWALCQGNNLADLLIGKGEPRGDINWQVRLRLHGVWNMLQRY